MSIPPAISGRLRQSKIAYVGSVAGESHIHVMNVDGSEQTRLTRDEAKHFQPTWSPDGGRIAFVSVPKDARAQLHVMGVDGSGARRLSDPNRGYSAPSWSPDGRRMAACRAETGMMELAILELDGGKETRLGDFAGTLYFVRDEDTRSSWSPDGNRVAITIRGTGIGLVNLKRPSEAVPLWQSHERGHSYSMPAWSPDGKRIAFVSNRDDNEEIYVIGADGSNPRRLTSNPAQDLWPSWSPDGLKIAFASQRYGNWEIYVMDADGSNPARLTGSPEKKTQPSWSPFLK
jgi:Tol biopolymer transport system component